MTGIRGLYRPSHAHPLNMKQVAIHHSELMGKRYEDCNYVIMHMGGGTSIAAHEKGRAVDSTRIGDGQGPICPNRSGDLCIDDVMTLMRRGMTLEEINEVASRRGGLMQLCGTDDVRKIRGEMIPAGDKRAKLALDAMEYTMVKWAAMMAGRAPGQGGRHPDDRWLGQRQGSGGTAQEGPELDRPHSTSIPAALRLRRWRPARPSAERRRESEGVHGPKPVWDSFDFD